MAEVTEQVKAELAEWYQKYLDVAPGPGAGFRSETVCMDALVDISKIVAYDFEEPGESNL